MTTPGERIVRVETELRLLKETVDKNITHVDEEFVELHKKMDDILALRNKGAGIFWLISCVVGTGLVGIILQVIGWFKGH